MKKRVLIVCDKPNWAFDTIAKSLVKHNDQPGLHIDIAYLKQDHPDYKFIRSCRDQYDLFFPIHWSIAGVQKRTALQRLARKPIPVGYVQKIVPRFPFLPKEKVITGIHAHHDWDRGRSMPDHDCIPPETLVDFLRGFKGVNVVSNRLFNVFSAVGLDNLALTQNGVDADLFRPAKAAVGTSRLVVGTSGTKARDEKEGISEFIEPLADLPFVELRLAIPQEGKYIPHHRMPEFLNALDVYVLASRSEGFPLKGLEASACGCAVVTTKVGGMEDLISHGVNGYFIERSLSAIREVLLHLHNNRTEVAVLGERNRQNIESLWCWKKRAGDWLRFIQSHI